MNKSYPFPPEIISPSKKILPEYGLAHVKAQFYSENVTGLRLGMADDQYQTMIELAQGRASTDPLKRLFGWRDDPQLQRDKNGPEGLVSVNPQILNLLPKYINKAVGKMQRMNYDISLEAVDIVSLNDKEKFMNTVQTFYELKDWIKNMGLPLQRMFPDIDIASLPEYPDELLYNLTVNPKVDIEIKGELALKLVLWVNRFSQKQREVDWDICVHGIGHIHCYLDHNNIPRIDRLNPKFVRGSYVDNDDFEKRDWAYFVEAIPVSQLVREASHIFKQESLQKIVDQYGIAGDITQPAIYNNSGLLSDNSTYINVVRFYFLSEDNKNFISRKTQFGTPTIFDRDKDFVPKNGERYQPGGDSKIYGTQYTSLYGGTWIIDSDIVYNYGRKSYPRTQLVNMSLPIKTAATNYKEGRAVSFMSQILEPAQMINVAWNKIKTALAKESIGVREINFDAIEKVGMGRGGQEWTPQEVYRYFEMTNDLISRGGSVDPKYGATTGRAINFINTGVQLADYFTTISTCINVMEQMTGTPISESADVPDRLPAAAVVAAKMSSEMDMEYLFNAHNYLFERVAHQTLLLTQEAAGRGVDLKGKTGVMGAFHRVTKEVAYPEYEMTLSKQAGPEEWAEFYLDIREMIKQGRLGAADSAYLRNIDNIKQARQMLAVREKQYQRQMEAEARRNNELMMESNARAAEAKMQVDAAIAQQNHGFDMELKELDGRIKMLIQQAKLESDGRAQGLESQMKQTIERDRVRGEIIKSGVKNQSEFYKADMQERVGMENARIKEKQADKPQPKAKAA